MSIFGILLIVIIVFHVGLHNIIDEIAGWFCNSNKDKKD